MILLALSLPKLLPELVEGNCNDSSTWFDKLTNRVQATIPGLFISGNRLNILNPPFTPKQK
jgi:hypothetical protein